MKNEQQIAYPSRDVVNNIQIQNCLNVIGQLTHALTAASKYGESTNELPPAAKSAAESTFVQACAALDCILVDRTRFSIHPQQTLEGQIAEVHAENLRFLTAQRVASEELSTPHFQHKPNLLKLNDGNWAAYLGELENLDRSIVGVGPTPAQALSAFDSVFSGVVPEYMRLWIERRAEILQQNYAEKQLDKQRSNPTKTATQRKAKAPRDRKPPGANG